MEFKTPDRYTRAGKWGKRILCPHCMNQSIVYHFSWSAKSCLHCKADVKKNEWKVEVTS
jgi:ribosomal protein S27E